MLTCFSEGVSAAKLDREPFKFRHRLVGHPALEMGNLARVIPALPKDQVMYAIRPLQNGLVQFYALTTAMGVAAFIGYLVFLAK